jgi:hypothetical protein
LNSFEFINFTEYFLQNFVHNDFRYMYILHFRYVYIAYIFICDITIFKNAIKLILFINMHYKFKQNSPSPFENGEGPLYSRPGRGQHSVKPLLGDALFKTMLLA